MPIRRTQGAPSTVWIPKAIGAATVDASTAPSPLRAFAVTSVISAGSSRGVTELRVIAYAFCSTSTPNAAGNSVTGSPVTAPDIAQHSRPRASIVPIMMYRRPCRTRSSMGPMNGASSANGVMVRTR